MCLLDFTLMQKSGPLRMVVKLRCSFICVKQQNISYNEMPTKAVVN